MAAKCVVFLCFTLFALLLSITAGDLRDLSQKEFFDGNNHRGCAYLHCGRDEVCVHRKFRCKDPPCSSMLYCAKSRTESLRGPSTCDTVLCTNGHICMLKVRRCHWDDKCEQQIARCVSRKEYHEGPASCAGFKCPQGNHCILRESFCVNPPCKLLRSCSKNKEVHLWFAKCRSLGCSSEYECFLRRPQNTCSNPPCKHTPDCIIMKEDEETNEHCLGWMCPQMQTCAAEVVGSCEADNCNIKRTCYEVYPMATNDSSSSFSRRSLKNGNDVPRVNTEPSSESFQQNGPEEIKTPQSWLSHFNSETELDAIELWIQNAEGQKDFKQFQDWLRSVKDILGSGAYSSWLEDILSSRGKEFRKWLLDAEEPIFPGQNQPRTLTENPYSVQDTVVNVPPQIEFSKGIEEIELLLREKNLTNVLERILLSNTVLLPPYISLETALLNNLRESTRSPPSNYFLKHPFYVGNQFLPLTPPKIETTYDQPYLVVPVKNMKDLANSRAINYNSDVEIQNQLEINAEDENGQKNLSSIQDESSSLRNELTEDFEETLAKKGMHSTEDSIDLSEDKRLADKAQDFDVVPIDLLEKLLKSMQFPLIENASQTSDEKPTKRHQDILPKDPRTEEYSQNFEWSSVSHIQNNKDIFKDKTIDETADQFPFSNDGRKNFQTFHEKLGSIESLNHSNPSKDVDSVSPRQENNNEENDEVDLNLFFELNKENLLPYMQTLMEEMNEENDPPGQNAELNPDEISAKNVPSNNEQITNGVTNKLSDESRVSKAELRNNSMKEALNNVNSYHDSQFLKQEITSSNPDIQQGKGSRISTLTYTDEEPTIRTLYNIPSFGSSNGEGVFQDYAYVEYNHTEREGGN